MTQSRFVDCPGREALIEARSLITSSDRVLIPAHNERPYVGKVIAYLFGVGFRPEQVVVVDSRSIDDTATIARSSGVPDGNVVDEAGLFLEKRKGGKSIAEHVTLRYGVLPDRVCGKGAAMYAGLVKLYLDGWFGSSGRLFLLDADLICPDAPDPIASLLFALKTSRKTSYAKCTMYQMGATSGLDKLLASVPHPDYFHTYFSLQSLLGGQVAFRDAQFLLDLRIPTAYAFELACHFQAVDFYGPEGVALVNLPSPLEHDKGTLAGYAVMDTLLLEFAVRVANSRVPLIHYTTSDIQKFNAHFAGLTVSARNGPVESTTGRMDLLLPSLRELARELF